MLKNRIRMRSKQIASILTAFSGRGEQFGYICAEGAARKRLVMSQRRYEGACNRIADANVTFCERGGAVKRVTDFLCNKKSEQA